MLVPLRKILKQSQRGKYALGAFNTHNLEITKGIIQGAVDAHAPIIIQVTESTINYAGLQAITQIIKVIANDSLTKVPIALHLDHGKKFSTVVACIKVGFSSVMIDASALSWKENVKLTKQVVKYAHQRNVLVQAELGHIGKEGVDTRQVILRPEKYLTNPDDAVEFVKLTHIDTLAVAIGNVHGIYKLRHGVPKIHLNRLAKIAQKVKIPFVLHGASGISDKEIKQAIKLGVGIINIDSELRMTFAEAIRKILRVRKQLVDPRTILLSGERAVRERVMRKIKLFGSFNKAK